MSDLFDIEDELAESSVHPRDFLLSIAGKKISIESGADIQFPPGWQEIVQTFIVSVKKYSIRLTQCTDVRMQLDISFDATGTNKELVVWRAVEQARRRSRAICACCGEEKKSRWGRHAVTVLCETCTHDAGNLGKTGTWLDKY